MEASAEVGGNPGKLLPKAGQASCDDVVATSPQLNRGRSLLGKEMGVHPMNIRRKGLLKTEGFGHTSYPDCAGKGQ